MGILSWLNPLKVVLDPINHITDKLADAYLARQKAMTDDKRIEADKTIAQLQAQRDTMIAEAQAGDKTNSRMRAAIAAPVAIVLWKVLVWDKALGQWTGGHTDALDPNLWKVCMIVIGFYFLYSAVKEITKK